MCIDTFHPLSKLYGDPTSPDGRFKDAEKQLKDSMDALARDLPASRIARIELSDAILLPSYGTHTLHVLGRNDVIVVAERAQTLLDVSANKRVEYHDGGTDPPMSITPRVQPYAPVFSQVISCRRRRVGRRSSASICSTLGSMCVPQAGRTARNLRLGLQPRWNVAHNGLVSLALDLNTREARAWGGAGEMYGRLICGRPSVAFDPHAVPCSGRQT